MNDLDVLINAYADARRAREDKEEEAKRLHESEEIVERQLFSVMEAQSLRSVKHERGTFYLNDQAWAKVADEDAARTWAEAEKPELITLNRQRLSVIVRERILSGEEMPPGVDFTTTQKIGWRRG